jgi:hypothetical protein
LDLLGRIAPSIREAEALSVLAKANPKLFQFSGRSLGSWRELSLSGGEISGLRQDKLILKKMEGSSGAPPLESLRLFG